MRKRYYYFLAKELFGRNMLKIEIFFVTLRATNFLPTTLLRVGILFR